MSDEMDQRIRDWLGVVLAGLRGDDTGYRLLRDEIQGQGGDVVSTAFATLSYIAALIGDRSGQSPDAVLTAFASAQTDPLPRTVWEMAVAGEREDWGAFDRLGSATVPDNRDFIPAVFGATQAIAGKLGEFEGKSAEQVLQDLAMTAARGEAGLAD